MVNAGYPIAQTVGLTGLSVNAVVAGAGVAKGTFYVHFKSREDYLLALHADFHEGLKRRIGQAVSAQSPGPEWLRAAALAYLDGCLSAQAPTALLVEARAEPTIGTEVRKRGAELALLGRSSFEAMGWPSPETCAVLFGMLISDAALMEVTRGRSDTVRDALLSFVTRN